MYKKLIAGTAIAFCLSMGFQASSVPSEILGLETASVAQACGYWSAPPRYQHPPRRYYSSRLAQAHRDMIDYYVAGAILSNRAAVHGANLLERMGVPVAEARANIVNAGSDGASEEMQRVYNAMRESKQYKLPDMSEKEFEALVARIDPNDPDLLKMQELRAAQRVALKRARKAGKKILANTLAHALAGNGQAAGEGIGSMINDAKKIKRMSKILEESSGTSFKQFEKELDKRFNVSEQDTMTKSEIEQILAKG